jgi:probable HAF family extracellular repeat protein
MRRLTSSLIALVAFTLPLLALAEPRYNVTTLAGAGSWASDINRAGQVAGTMMVGDARHAFVFSSSMATDIGTLGGADSIAARMNDLGQVVGTSMTGAGDVQTGFIYSGGTISSVSGTNILNASGINNAGMVTGTASIPIPGSDAQYHAYVVAGGTFTDLGTIPGRYESHGYDINNAGHVAGSTSMLDGGPPNWPTNPMMYRGGAMTDLGDGGFMGPWSYATAINEHDQIVGVLGVDFSDPGGDLYPRLAFLYQDGVLRTLGGFGPNLSSWAADINNGGQIVGWGNLGEGLDAHAFLFQDGAMTDLNTLIDPGSGWVITEAQGINDLGQIAGRACKGGECYAVRLDLVSAVPAPAPAALWLTGLGLFGLARVVRRPARRRRG